MSRCKLIYSNNGRGERCCAHVARVSKVSRHAAGGRRILCVHSDGRAGGRKAVLGPSKSGIHTTQCPSKLITLTNVLAATEGVNRARSQSDTVGPTCKRPTVDGSGRMQRARLSHVRVHTRGTRSRANGYRQWFSTGVTWTQCRGDMKYPREKENNFKKVINFNKIVLLPQLSCK
jgi:hypothetical protein